MKTIIKNQKNVIECECGAIIEYDSCDCGLKFTNKSKGTLQVIVKCPNCQKEHKATLKELNAIEEKFESIKNVNVEQKEMTFKEIKENADIIPIGFTKKFKLKNGTEAVFEVAGKKHDVNKNGEKTNLTLVLKDLLGCEDDESEQYYDHAMNEEWTNKGGWRDSDMRKYLNNELINELPDELIELIQEVKKQTYCDGELVETTDKLFLLSESEVHGNVCYAKGVEGEQYELYKDWHKRIKGHNGCEYGDWYWLRSSYSSTTGYFVSINTYGIVTSGTATISRGLSLALCI